MKKVIRLVLPIATLLAAFLATNGVSFATKEIAKTEKKACTVCHEKGNMKVLTADGKAYKAAHPAPKK